MTVTAQRRAVHDRPALRRVVAMTVEDFATDRWGVAPVLSTPGRAEGTCSWPDGLATGFADLFSLDAADELLSVRGLRVPFLRLAKNGNVVPAGRFTRSGGVGATIADQVDADAVARAYADGATVVFQALHRVWPPLIDFTAQLVADLGHPVQVNAYLTPPSAQGFSAHYDTHDVFVVQVAGRKHWTIHRPVLESPSTDEPWDDRRQVVEARASEPAYLETDLLSGDSLYLPRGWLHAARSGDEATLHLTFGVHPLTRRDVLAAVIDEVRRDPRIRASLPLGVDPSDADGITGDLAEVLQALRDVPVSTDVVARSLSARLARDTRPAPIRPVAQAAAAAQLGPKTKVRRRAQLRVERRPVDDSDETDLVLPDRVVRLPADADALVTLLSGDAVIVADLPGEDLAANLALVRRLLDEAVLVPAD